MFVIFEDNAGNKVTIDNATSSDSLATLTRRLNDVQPNDFQLAESDLKPSGLRLNESETHQPDTTASTSLVDRLGKLELVVKCLAPLKAPVEGCAVLFAGQGTDVAKTIKKLSASTTNEDGPWASKSAEFFQSASDALGYDLLDVCNNQPDLLATTAYSQPAIFVASLATMEKYKLEQATSKIITHAAGFSLGEYAALVFSGAISMQDGIRLIKIRAEAMQKAAEESQGSMVTVIGLDDAKMQDLCNEAESTMSGGNGKSIVVANHLFPKGRVLSGDKELVGWVVKNAKGRGAMMANELSVAGAFHSPHMASASPDLEKALQEIDIQEPRIPVFSNVTGKRYGNVADIKRLLVEQLVSPVLWEQTIKGMVKVSGVKSFIDAGPGQQLKSMMRRIDPKSFRATATLDVN